MNEGKKNPPRSDRAAGALMNSTSVARKRKVGFEVYVIGSAALRHLADNAAPLTPPIVASRNSG